MEDLLPEEIDDFINLAENNLKMEVKEAKKRRSSKLVVVSNSTASSRKSYFGSTTISSIESSDTGGGTLLNESSFSGSLIEDMELPTSFNGSTIEEMLSISNESSINISATRSDVCFQLQKAGKLKSVNNFQDSEESSRFNKDVKVIAASNIKEVNKSVSAVGVTPERWSSCNTSSMNTFFLCSETERVLEALESEKDFCSPPPSRMTILDLSTLNDSLIPETPNFKKYGADGLQDIRELPSMSTPKNTENMEDKCAINDCRISLNFNGTFDREFPAVQKENTFVLAEEKKEAKKIEKNLPLNETKTLAINTTFDKGPSVEEAKEPFNVTFETELIKEGNDNLNRTFEVVGNGSFIIEGKCTNLMDMESGILETVLSSATSTPMARGTKSYPDTKKLCKSTLRKRLSMLTCQSQEEAKTGNADSQNSLYQPLEENREILPASKFESRNPLGPLTKEQVLNRLRKNTNTGSLLGNNGPMKAVPLPSVVSSMGKGKLFEDLRKRAASTPTDRLLSQQKNKIQEENSSDEKNGKIPSLPSFGSVSSIGTDGGQNGREVGSDDFMVTPEVFRHRGKIGGPHITSTPTVLPCNLKFETDLGLGLAPTPIVAPFMDLQEKNIGKDNCSYVVENSKKIKNKLNFTTSNEGSNDSVFLKENATNNAEADEDQPQGSFSKEEIQNSLNKELKNLGNENVAFASTENENAMVVENAVEGTTVLPMKCSTDYQVSNLGNENVVFASTENDNAIVAENADFEPVYQVSKIGGDCIKVLTSTVDVDNAVQGLKSAISASNLSSIKEIDLSKKLHLEEINPVNKVDQKIVISPKKVCCCQCGNVKILESEDGTSTGEKVKEKEKETEFLKIQESEISVLQNATSNANEMIEAYEEMCRKDIPNFTNEFNDTKTDVKPESLASSNMKNEFLSTTKEVVNLFEHLANPIEVVNLSEHLANPIEVVNVSTNSSNNINLNSKDLTKSQLSLKKDTSKMRKSISNLNLNAQTLARRLTTAPSNPGTPRSSHQNKRESLSNSKTRPALKLVTAANMPSVRRRETFLKNGASNVQQTSKLEIKSLPPKLLPKIKSTLHAKTFPEGKRLPPKAASKITLHARTLPKAVSNEQLKLESVRSKMLPSRLAPKIPNVGVKSTSPANSTLNLIHKVPNTNIGTKSVINKSSNSQDAVSKVPNTNIGMKGTINQRSSPRTVVTKVPNSNINSKSTINQPCSPCNVPKVLNTNKGTKSTINQPSSPRNVLSSNIGTKSTINQSSSLRTLAPKVTNPNTGKKTTIINPQIPCTSTAKRESIVGGSRLRYSSANKENAFGLNPAKKSMIGSGIRPPNFRTSIPAPRNVQ